LAFSGLDYIVLCLYLIGVAYFGLRASGKQESADDYFLGGHQIPWWAVLFSIVATETSTLTFISIPAVSYGGNLTFLQITLGYLIGRILVARYFLPRYFEGELFTAYTFLEKRFGAGMRNAASITFIITRVLADGVRLFATAIPIAIILRMGDAFSWAGDLELYLYSIILIAIITLFYTFFGGIKAVVWMDVVQMVVYIGGAFIALTVLMLNLPDSVTLPPEKLRIIDFGFGQSFKNFIQQPYTFFTAVIGGAVFSLASHGTDQLLVQRILVTRDLKEGQRALILSGVVVMFQFALFLVIGLLLFSFYEGQSAEALGLSTNDEVFSRFIVEELPAGISGLIIAALFAAAMSSLSSSLNSLASSSTFDLLKPYLNKKKDPAFELRLSRYSTLFWGLILSGSALFFAFLQLQEGQRPAVVELGLGIASYTYGGLLGVFLLGIFFNKPSMKDAMIGFFTALIALLFMVKGPVQEWLPGEGLAVAWPLYTLIGSCIVMITGRISTQIRSFLKL
jgi:SSS family transporter